MICTPHLIFSVDQIEKNEMGMACSTYGERRVVYEVLVGKPEGKRQLGRHRHRWEDNIILDIQEVECGVMDWIDLAHDRGRWWAPVNTIINLRIP